MLSSDQFVLLYWIDEQSAPMTLEQMAEFHAPAFTEQRVAELYRQGLLTREMVSRRGALIGGYSASDKGRALLEQTQREDHARTQQIAEKRADRRTQVFCAILGAVVGALLTLLLEHSGEIVSFFTALTL